MKRVLCLCLMGALAATAMAQQKMAAERGLSEPKARLTTAYLKISSQSFKEALEDLLWCYDNGAKADPTFDSLRNSLVVDAIVGICPVLPEAVNALETRRAAKLQEVGDPPRIDPAFFDLLALNRALEDDAANDELLQKAAAAGAIQKFSGKTLKSQPPPVPKGLVVKQIRIRADEVRAEVVLKPCADARAKLSAAKEACDQDARLAAEQQAKMQAQIASLRDQLEKLGPEEQGHLIAKMREMVRQLRDEIQTRAAQLAKEKAYYEELLRWCESQKEEPAKKG